MNIAISTSSGHALTIGGDHRQAEVHRCGADRRCRADDEGSRASSAGDLSGGDVRWSIRRFRRLPAVRWRALSPARHQARAFRAGRVLLQLAAYADVLAAAGVPVADEVELVLGDGATAAYHIHELLPVYRPRRAELERLLDTHFAGGAAVAWEDEDVRACFRCPECTTQVRAHDDLLMVANMRVSQRARLIDAGITTMTELAQHDGPVPELPAQDRCSADRTGPSAGRAADRRQAAVRDRRTQPLNLLPDPDKGDLFFDFEGDPLWTADGAHWGLEYLFGRAGGRRTFRPLWAHDRPQRASGLPRLSGHGAQARKRYPKMHIYHYASYEKTALLRLAGRYGVGEDEVDDLSAAVCSSTCIRWYARASASVPKTTA